MSVTVTINEEIINVNISNDGPQGARATQVSATFAEAEDLTLAAGQMVLVDADETQSGSPASVYVFNGTELKFLQIIA